ncbi:hypothetical protein L1887_58282 [Cichorium endivia]|nr:hypothetical protein L1887_58282 [Cichorium endivia]
MEPRIRPMDPGARHGAEEGGPSPHTATQNGDGLAPCRSRSIAGPIDHEAEAGTARQHLLRHPARQVRMPPSGTRLDALPSADVAATAALAFVRCAVHWRFGRCGSSVLPNRSWQGLCEPVERLGRGESRQAACRRATPAWLRLGRLLRVDRAPSDYDLQCPTLHLIVVSVAVPLASTATSRADHRMTRCSRSRVEQSREHSEAGLRVLLKDFQLPLQGRGTRAFGCTSPWLGARVLGRGARGAANQH